MNSKYTGKELKILATQSAIAYDPYDYTFNNNITTAHISHVRAGLNSTYFIDPAYLLQLRDNINEADRGLKLNIVWSDDFEKHVMLSNTYGENQFKSKYYNSESSSTDTYSADRLLFTRTNRSFCVDLDHYIRLKNINNTSYPFLNNPKLPVDTRQYRNEVDKFDIQELKSLFMLSLAIEKHSKLYILYNWIARRDMVPSYEELINPMELLESGTEVIMPFAYQTEGNLYNLTPNSYVDSEFNYNKFQEYKTKTTGDLIEHFTKNITMQLALYAELIYLINTLKPQNRLNIINLLRLNANEDNVFTKLIYNPILDTYANEDIEHILQNKNTKLRYELIYNYLKINFTTISEEISNGDKFNFATSPFFIKFYLYMLQIANNDYMITFVTASIKLAKDYAINIEGTSQFDKMSKTFERTEGQDINALEDLFSDDKSNYDDKPTEPKEESLDPIVNRSKVLAPLENIMEKTYNKFADDIYSFKVRKEISNEQKDIDRYNVVANKVKLVNNLLIKNIRAIKTYNEGAKLSGLESGKIDGKNLYKYKTDNKIFTKNKYKIKESDLAIGVLLDVSGSMSGQKIIDGRTTLIVMHETLRALNINHAIYTHSSEGQLMSTVKEYHSFKESKLYSINKAYAISDIQADGGNCDSGALHYVQKDISRTNNKDKIVIVFSDGEPTECSDNQLINQVKKMEKAGIKVIGVGINLPSIADYYTDYANGKNLTDMLNIFSKILKEYVLQKAE
jgi:uncharacterized protein YegL